MPAESIDASRFPALASYVARLPNGLASHPHAQMKASLYREALADKPIPAAVVAALPAQVADLVMQPRLVSTWVPSVHVQALFLAISDAHGMQDATFVAWTYVLQKRLYRSPLYRAITIVATARMLLNGTQVRWGAMHRGTDLEVDAGTGEARARIRFPTNLYARRNLLGFTAGFRAIVELADATNVRVELADARPTQADFAVRWE